MRAKKRPRLAIDKHEDQKTQYVSHAQDRTRAKKKDGRKTCVGVKNSKMNIIMTKILKGITKIFKYYFINQISETIIY